MVSTRHPGDREVQWPIKCGAPQHRRHGRRRKETLEYGSTRLLPYLRILLLRFEDGSCIVRRESQNDMTAIMDRVTRRMIQSFH